MALTSPLFLLFALAVVLAANACASIAARQWVLAIASAVFIASYAQAPLQLLPLAVFLALCFGVLRAVQWRPSRGVLIGALVLVVGGFIYLKKFSFIAVLPALPFAYLALGLSYVLFRVVHLLVDAAQGNLAEKLSPLRFFNYTCNFLGFVSGPIQRYPESFAAQRTPPPALDEQTVYAACARVVTGYVKVAIVSAVANYAFSHLSARLTGDAAGMHLFARAGLMATTAALYTAYLYYNFAGYMDIVIGIGRLFGCELPENFNRPFAARNFLDFWARWHITLSEWFKVYVFNPLLKALAMRVEAPALQPWLGVVAFFFTFLLMGMWHGTTNVFLVYGLAMGAGASVNKLWQVALQRGLGKPRYKALAAQPLYAGLCRGLSAAWFALALTCFWVDMAQLRALLAALGVVGFVLAYLVLSVAAACALAATEAIGTWLTPRLAGIGAWGQGVVARNLLLGTQVLLIASVASFFHKAPEFVYRAF